MSFKITQLYRYVLLIMMDNNGLGDGDIDCGEDEVNCMRTGCPESMFECDNHQCIDFAYYCDGSPDCHDSSDELPGCIESPLKRPRCESEQFECDNGHCLPKSVMCNLVYDCEDGSDENATLCKNSSLICAGPDFYRCGKQPFHICCGWRS